MGSFPGSNSSPQLGKEPNMTILHQRMIEELEIRNHSEGTRDTYLRAVAGFAQYHGKSPDLLAPEDVRAYQVHIS